MFRKLTFSILSCLAISASALAQMPKTIAIDELTGEDSLVPYRKLLTEYIVTELAACNLVKVVGYDKVNAAKAALKTPSIKQADAKDRDAVLKKLNADAICFGVIVRDGTAVNAEISVFQDGVVSARKATVTLKSIEDTDNAAKKLAGQIESIVKGTEYKLPADATTDSDRKVPFVVPGVDTPKM